MTFGIGAEAPAVHEQRSEEPVSIISAPAEENPEEEAPAGALGTLKDKGLAVLGGAKAAFSKVKSEIREKREAKTVEREQTEAIRQYEQQAGQPSSVSQPLPASQPPPVYSAPPEKKKNKLLPVVIILAAALLIMAGVFLYFLLKDRKQPEATDPATEATDPVTEAPTETEPPTEAPTEAPTTVTEAPTTTAVPTTTTEAPTEDPVEAFFEGVWQGSDANVTTIEIHKDHTLYYRELNNKKYSTVVGTRGTWEANDTNSIKISLPSLGNGYELLGVAMADGSFLLQCLNGRPWSDEYVHKSNISLKEIETIVKNRLAQMLKDGSYGFFEYDGVSCSWEGDVFVIKRFDGAYARIYRDRMESTIEVYDRSTGGTISGKKIIPIAAGCWANDSVRESVLSNIQVFCDQLDVVELCFNVQDGEIANMFSY